MSNQMNGAEALVKMLEVQGVRHVFGLCGDTSLPFYDAMRGMDHGMTHVLTRDERSATYMADAYARVTGRPGVCEGPSGGGAAGGAAIDEPNVSPSRCDGRRPAGGARAGAGGGEFMSSMKTASDAVNAPSATVTVLTGTWLRNTPSDGIQ